MEDQVQHFESKFGDLVKRAYEEVTREMEPRSFLVIFTYLPVSARHLHRKFIKKKLTNIPPPVTFEKIWSIQNLYWDFLNYGLLENIIYKCTCADLNEQMKNYVDELSAFKRKLVFVTSSIAGHVEMIDHQMMVSNKWLPKWRRNGHSAHYMMWSLS